MSALENFVLELSDLSVHRGQSFDALAYQQLSVASKIRQVVLINYSKFRSWCYTEPSGILLVKLFRKHNFTVSPKRN